MLISPYVHMVGYTMSKQSQRLFLERPVIELLLQKAIDGYQPTGDETLDLTINALLMEEVPQLADTFMTCLYSITQDMCLGEWNDFWFDMGIRVYDAENEYDDLWDAPFDDFDDEEEYDCVSVNLDH